MALPAKTPKTQAGVSLDVEVMNYLDEIATSDDRDRSYVINRIIREWAVSKGTPIPLKRKEPKRAKQA